MTARAAPAGARTRLLLFLAWAAVALFFVSRHVMWRDEVRAWDLALSGDNVFEMLRAIHGEGHPALWYLLVRSAHTLIPEPYSLPVLAFAIGACGVALLAWRAPFGWGALAAILFARFTLYEYAVMARNYGISALILYAIAAVYPKQRDRGWPIGLLLLLLCNTNVPSVILAGAFLLFWAVDIRAERGEGAVRRWRGWAIGAAGTGAGALLCFVTVYPPFNDAAPVVRTPGISGFFDLIHASGYHFGALLPDRPFEFRHYTQIVLAPALVIGAILYFARVPGALVSVVTALGGMFALFAFVYDGEYRHQALFLCYLVTIAWLVAKGHGGHWPERPARRIAISASLERVGAAALAVLFGFQIFQSGNYLLENVKGVPQSRVGEVARLLHRPDLHDAIVIGDPDYMIEPIAFYAKNPLYFVRDHRFGRYVHLTKAAQRAVRDTEMLDEGRRLRAASGRPVVILMSENVFRRGASGQQPRGSYGDLIATPGALDRYRAAASEVLELPAAYGSDESYDVFILAASSSRAAPEPPSRARGASANSAGRASPQAAKR